MQMVDDKKKKLVKEYIQFTFPYVEERKLRDCEENSVGLGSQAIPLRNKNGL